MMANHSRIALVGDIGGTYISLGVADIDELSIDHFALLTAADFSSPTEAIERYLQSIPRCPDKVSIAVAGAPGPEGYEMTHRPWTVTERDIRAVTGAEWVSLLNDLEAMALAVPNLSDYDIIEVSQGEPVADATKVIVNAGTGLGVAGIVWSGDKWVPIRGEGGHVAFPATAPDEFDIKRVFPGDGFISAGMVLSGAGLVALYEAMARSRGDEPEKLTAPQIAKVGLAGEDPVAAEAVDLTATWLTRFAADVGLLYGATGGIYFAGGLAATIIPAIQAKRVRAAFADKGTAAPYLERIPLRVIKTGADAGLRGAAIAMARELPGTTPAKPRRAPQRAQ